MQPHHEGMESHYGHFALMTALIVFWFLIRHQGAIGDW